LAVDADGRGAVRRPAFSKTRMLFEVSGVLQRVRLA
jgi:hypothetical protein